jgi:tetratricopeptide (TPR) repeat protein
MRTGGLAVFALAAALAGAAPQPARAVFSGDMSPRAPSGDADYAAALAARRAGDWPASIAALERVVARRPWHDNAHSLLGNAYRRTGDYERALAHYHRAIALNPRHREALEYLGVAYLHMDRPDLADETLAKLLEVCRFVALSFSDGDFSDGCDEYRELREAVAHYARTGEPPPEDDEP